MYMWLLQGMWYKKCTEDHNLPKCVSLAILCWCSGFQVDVAKFFTFWLIMQLINMCAVSLAFVVSASVRNGAVANLLIVLPFIVSLVCPCIHIYILHCSNNRGGFRTLANIDLMCLTSQLKYVRLFPDNAAILSGKKRACFYTISEIQAARNLYFQYGNYH